MLVPVEFPTAELACKSSGHKSNSNTWDLEEVVAIQRSLVLGVLRNSAGNVGDCREYVWR